MVEQSGCGALRSLVLAQDPVGETGGQERELDNRRMLFFGFAPGAMSSRMLVPASRSGKTLANTEALDHARHYSTPVRRVTADPGSIAPMPHDMQAQTGAWLELRNEWRSL